MPLKYWICPDGGQISIQQCAIKCRMDKRCLSRSTLKLLAQQREDLGAYSVTELLNGPRYEYLKRKHFYSTNPEELAFALLGTKVHKELEQAPDYESINEKRLYAYKITGQFDIIEYENEKFHLIDRKTWGNYKVKKFLEHGDDNLELQLNMLKLCIEAQNPPLKIGSRIIHQIHKLSVEIIVRDGGTYIARNNKIPFKMKLLEVPILDKSFVQQYFENKRQELTIAIEKNIMPRLCNEEEAWNGARCKAYCSVSSWCENHGDNHYLKKGKK